MSINSLLKQIATIYPKSGYDKFGRDISGTSFNSRCRFENKTSTKVLKNGQVVMLLGKLYLPGNISINTEDRISIDNFNYKVFSVNGHIDGHGNQKLITCDVEKWAPK